jgi:hypothetical protein
MRKPRALDFRAYKLYFKYEELMYVDDQLSGPV